MSDGIRSGVNWMREKFSSSDLGQRLHQQRLGQPGHADQQAMAPRKQRIQRRQDDLLLPDNHLGHLILEQANPGRELVEHRGGVVFDDRWRGVAPEGVWLGQS